MSTLTISRWQGTLVETAHWRTKLNLKWQHVMGNSETNESTTPLTMHMLPMKALGLRTLIGLPLVLRLMKAIRLGWERG